MARSEIRVRYDKLLEYIENTKEKPEIDFVEFIARQAVDSLISDINFEVKKDCQDSLVIDFVNNIKQNGYNDLVRLIRGCEWDASRYGCFYAGFEFMKDNIIFYSAKHSPANNVIKINNVVDYAVIIERDIVSSPVGNLTVRDCIFKNGYSRYVMSYLPLNENQLTLGEFQVPSETYIEKSGNFQNQGFETNRIKTNYGVLSCKQFLNTDKKINANESPWKLADCYPATGLIVLILDLLKFMKDEQSLNFTKIIGNFSAQDVNARKIKVEKEAEISRLDKFNRSNKLSSTQSFLAGIYGGNDDDTVAMTNLLKSKMFIQTNGNPNETIISQPSTFNGVPLSDYLKSLMSKAADLSGYSYDDNSTAMYKNEAEIANVNKNVYETTKKKKLLRTNDWYDLFGRALYVYAKMKGIPAEKAKSDYQDKVKELINFEIVSNLLMDHLNNDDRIIKLLGNGLIDKETAIRIVNSDKDEADILDIIENSEIEQQKYIDSINGISNTQMSDNEPKNSVKSQNKDNEREKLDNGKDK